MKEEMTIDTTAKEIAAKYTDTWPAARDLELAILRHMEHHVLRHVEAEREACAKLATSFLVGDPLKGVPFRSPTAHEIAKAIRARAA